MAPLESNFGVHSAREIPVLIPNTEVKPGSGDYTALRETSKMPNYMKRPPQRVAFHLVYKNESHLDRWIFCATKNEYALAYPFHITNGALAPFALYPN